MTMRKASWLTVMLVLTVATALSADRIRLRSGKAIEGVFIGGDSKTVRLLLDSGQVSEVALWTRSWPSSSRRGSRRPLRRAPKPAAAPKPRRRRRSRSPCLPARRLNVRLTQAIDVDASQAGMTFKGIVDDPVMVGGSIVIPRGASAVVQAVKVEQSGTMKGSDKISLKAELDRLRRLRLRSRDDLRRDQREGRRQDARRARSAAAPAWARLSGALPAAGKARRSAPSSAA